MRIRLQTLFSAALPIVAALAISSTKPPEKTAQVHATDSVCPACPPAAKVPAPAPATSTKGKERRPLQPWGRYWLTD